jgi:dolichyl-phosphate beta-glucosyltransferase
VLLVPGITDVTCGFKSYRGEVARELYSLQRLSRWAFDSEILFLAHKRGYRVKECAVRWHDERGTKVRLVRDAINSLKEIAQIRINDLLGYYNKKPAPLGEPDKSKVKL